jgi:hypothetical protein
MFALLELILATAWGVFFSFALDAHKHKDRLTFWVCIGFLVPLSFYIAHVLMVDCQMFMEAGRRGL